MAEKFLLLMTDIQKPVVRLNAVQFKSSFADKFSEVSNDLNILKLACLDLKNSKVFIQLLGKILAMGNHMNSSECGGFKVIIE